MKRKNRALGRTSPTRMPPRHRGKLGVLAMASTFALLVPPAVQEGSADVDSARAALEKWVETRRILSEEERDWALGKELLTERIDLVRNEIEALRERMSAAEGSIADADRKRAERVEENERYKEAAQALAETVARLEGRTRTLLARLPDPIRERVKPLSQRLPVFANQLFAYTSDPASEDKPATELSLSERFQNVVGILNEVDKFNREISLTSEVRKLPDGSSAEVTALYVGLGQGYYVGAGGTLAGIGNATDDAWVWTPANEQAAAIGQAVSILKNEAVAAFVKLPLEVR